MKPKLLKISGLNSFIEEQTIDFSTLIENGLFGIFGPTGSGKSTILDAITIALYGYNAIARNTKEFINTDLEKVYVSYEFDSESSLGRQAYRVERSIKKSKGGGIKTDFARLAFIDGEGNVTRLVDKVSEIDDEMSKIIGLNHRDFTRSVVLPQGKFSEFLKLSGSNRRNMLERILGLEKYGGVLVDKIKSFRKKREEELQVLRGELSRFEGITEENIKALKDELTQIQKKEKEIKSSINEIEKKYEGLSRTWGFQKELNEYLKIKEELKERSHKIEDLRNRWEKGKNARRVKPYLDRYNDTLGDINKNKDILKDTLIKLEDIKKKLEKTEEEYKVIYKKKDCELPVLIEKEANIKHAIELNEGAQRLIKERKKLAVKFTEYSQIIGKAKEELKKLKEDTEENDKKIEELENRSKTLKISPKYRESLNRAYNLENKYNELKKNQEKSLKDIENLNKRIISNEDILNKITKKLSEKEKAYNQIKDELEKLQAKPPEDKDHILKKEIELHKLKSVLEDTRENLKKKKALEEELRIIYDSKNEAGIKLDYLKNRQGENIERLEAVKNEIREMEKAHRAGLLSLHIKENEPCPVCGSCDHPNIAESIPEEAIERIMKIREGFEESKKETEKLMYELEIDIKRQVKEENKFKKELDTYLEKLKGCDVDSLEKKIKNSIEEIEGLKAALKGWEVRRKELGELLQAQEREKIDLEKQSIRFVEGVRKDRERLEEENRRKEELTTKLNKTNELYEEVKKELNVDNIDNEIERLKKAEKELLKLDSSLKELRSNIKEYQVQREKIEEKLNRAVVERSKVEEVGKEKRSIIDEYAQKIKNVVGDREPKNYLKEIQEKKTNIINEEQVLRKLKEEEREQLNKLQEKKIGLERTNKALEASLINIEKDLSEALKENKFDNLDEININLAANQELKLMEEEIISFDNDIKRVEDNINRISSELKGVSLEETDFLKLKEDMEAKKEDYRLLLEEVGKKKERINEMERSFERVKEINEKVKKLQHITDMLNEMFKLVAGNKFVEYVATSHLKYIAKEASKRLRDITNDRYSLELDSGGSFVICDNFNGGVRRSCNTLSGGETFLTSLALALSLSSQIQLKGNASIEFFFMDEGFGTLDSQLLDTVMTSLERLHRERLAVGIISHVNELKNRVPIKLMVTPPEAGVYGTKVDIERN